MDINERLELLEFKLELLFENTELNRLLFSNNVSREQLSKLFDLMENYRKEIELNHEVFSGTFEGEIYSILPQIKNSYHFCESFARMCWEQQQYEEVFPSLYGDSKKFEQLFNK